MDGTQVDKSLAITGYTHYFALQSLLFLAFILAVILYIVDYNRGMMISFSIGFGLDAISSLYLHFQYYAMNRGEKYQIQDTELIRIKQVEVTVYKNHEIEKIIVYLSPSLYKNSNFHFLAIEGYHYAVIKLKTGEELILTSLLSTRIDKSLKQMRGILVEKRKRLFCTF
jgi:hypothetical protein